MPHCAPNFFHILHKAWPHRRHLRSLPSRCNAKHLLHFVLVRSVWFLFLSHRPSDFWQSHRFWADGKPNCAPASCHILHKPPPCLHRPRNPSSRCNAKRPLHFVLVRSAGSRVWHQFLGLRSVPQRMPDFGWASAQAWAQILLDLPPGRGRQDWARSWFRRWHLCWLRRRFGMRPKIGQQKLSKTVENWKISYFKKWFGKKVKVGAACFFQNLGLASFTIFYKSNLLQFFVNLR